MNVHKLITLKLDPHDELLLNTLIKGKKRGLNYPALNRPGLALTGNFQIFSNTRIQVFGKGESAFLYQEQHNPGLLVNCKRLMKAPVPCWIFTHGLFPPACILELAEECSCPIFSTSLSTSLFTNRVTRVLTDMFAPRGVIHGVLVDVFGVGIILLGKSGIGKSETALELIQRGHRLVADDAIELKSLAGGNLLLGAGVRKEIAHFMEIRGLGIINIPHLFGAGAVRESKQIQLAIHLEEWNASVHYDRLGIERHTKRFLDIDIPLHTIPVRTGRNVAIIIEVAAMNARLDNMGYSATKDLDDTILKYMQNAQQNSNEEDL